MSPNKVYLKQLTTSSRNYKVKVRIIEKGRPKCSAKKGTLYQNLLLEDEQGSRMRGTLFGEQVEGFKDVLMYNGQYEIANAPIKHCEEQWKVSASDLNFQMHFGKPAIVERSENDENSLLPQYRSIAQIPKTADPTDKYDIAAVVLFVEQKPRRIVKDQDRVITVREIAVIDHSTDQPLIISAWNDLAKDECDLLILKAEQLQVVGFTALKVSTHKGFSMTTTMSTTIIHSAEGDRPRALEDWAASHMPKLSEIQARILTLRGIFGHHQHSTIAALRLKKAHSTLQDERYTLQVTIPDPNFQKINAYLGCSNCNRRTDVAAGNAFTCVHCSKSRSNSIPRVTFTCEVFDGSGSLPITAFTADAEKILQMLAPDIYRMKHSDDLHSFEVLKNVLQTSPFSIEVGPNTTLSTNNVLHWVLKKVADRTPQPPKSPTAQTQTDQPPPPDTQTAIVDNATQGNVLATVNDESTTKVLGNTNGAEQTNAVVATIPDKPLHLSKLISVKIENSKTKPAKKRTDNPAAYSQTDKAVSENLNISV